MYGLSTFKPYGADREIEEQQKAVRPGRPLIKIHYTRQRHHFVEKQADVKLSTTDAMEHTLEARPFKNVEHERIGHDAPVGPEHTICVQATPNGCEPPQNKKCQTPWFRMVSTAVQVEATVVDARQKALIRDAEHGLGVNSFLKKVMPKIDHSCVSNLELPLFQDDYEDLADDDTFLGNKDDAAFSDLGNFQHHMYTKGKRVTSIDWHPKNVRGDFVAISVGEAVTTDGERGERPFTYSDRLARNRKALNGLVVIWYFQDPINPAVILESPQEVNIVRFNPTQPNLIVGGCVNGQVVLWDISGVPGVLKDKGKKGHRGGKEQDKGLETTADSKAHVMWRELSKIESGHKRAVNDLVWISPHHEVNFDGKFIQAYQPTSETHKAKGSWGGTEQAPYCFEGARQFVTLSSDGFMFVWDLNKENMRKDRHRKIIGTGASAKTGADIPWIPLVKIQLFHPEDPSNNLIGMKFSMEDGQRNKENPYRAAVGTEEGEFVEVVWSSPDGGGKAGGFSQGDDGGRVQAVKLVAGFHGDGRRVGHHGAVMCVQRHPTLHDYYLTAGDWSFKVWKIGHSDPVIASPFWPTKVTAGAWSPTRPGVIFIGTENGMVQVWNLLDRSHEPIITQTVSQHPISAMEFKPVVQDGKSRKEAETRLAVGLRNGFLQVFKLPKLLTKPKANEQQETEKYFEREVLRGKYYAKRWAERRTELEERNAQRAQAVAEKPKQQTEQDEADNPFADPSQVELHLEEFKAQLRMLEEQDD